MTLDQKCNKMNFWEQVPNWKVPMQPVGGSTSCAKGVPNTSLGSCESDI